MARGEIRAPFSRLGGGLRPTLRTAVCGIVAWNCHAEDTERASGSLICIPLHSDNALIMNKK